VVPFSASADSRLEMRSFVADRVSGRLVTLTKNCLVFLTPVFSAPHSFGENKMPATATTASAMLRATSA